MRYFYVDTFNLFKLLLKLFKFELRLLLVLLHLIYLWDFMQPKTWNKAKVDLFLWALKSCYNGKIKTPFKYIFFQS